MRTYARTKPRRVKVNDRKLLIQGRRLSHHEVCMGAVFSALAEAEPPHVTLVRDALDVLGREANSPEALCLLVDAAGILANRLGAWHAVGGRDGALHATARGYRITKR